MNRERIISAYKNYFKDFISSLSDTEARKVFYVIDMLKTQERVNAKFASGICAMRYSNYVLSMVATSFAYSSSSTMAARPLVACKARTW